MNRTRRRWGLEIMYIREILRLYYQMGKKRQQIAASLGISYSAVRRAIAIADESGGIELLALGDQELTGILYPNSPGRKYALEKARLDFEYLVSELSRRGVTRTLLYREYKDNNPGNYYSYSVFCEAIRKYSNDSELTMALSHEPGEKAFLDYCGDKIPIYERRTHKVSFYAEVFVDTLACSGYTYFEAHRDQSQESFTGGIVRGFDYFGGVVKTLVPDNLKAGVITNSKTDLKLSRAMMELANYYQVFVDPARPYRARDKAKVEERVGYIQRNVIAALRDRRFYSLDELNQTFAKMTDGINAQPYSKKEGSRTKAFECEREYLSSLPLTPFVYGTWKFILVPSNYHIELDGCSYSVPSEYRNKKVEVKLCEKTLEIFHCGMHLATHQRSYTPGSVTTQNPHLHPNHRSYLASLDKDALFGKAKSVGPSTYEVGLTVFSSAASGESGARSLYRMLQLEKLYGSEELERACDYALMAGATGRRSIESILKTKVYQNSSISEPPSPIHGNLRPSGHFSKGDGCRVI